MGEIIGRIGPEGKKSLKLDDRRANKEDITAAEVAAAEKEGKKTKFVPEALPVHIAYDPLTKAAYINVTDLINTFGEIIKDCGSYKEVYESSLEFLKYLKDMTNDPEED